MNINNFAKKVAEEGTFHEKLVRRAVLKTRRATFFSVFVEISLSP